MLARQAAGIIEPCMRSSFPDSPFSMVVPNPRIGISRPLERRRLPCWNSLALPKSCYHSLQLLPHGPKRLPRSRHLPFACSGKTTRALMLVPCPVKWCMQVYAYIFRTETPVTLRLTVEDDAGQPTCSVAWLLSASPQALLKKQHAGDWARRRNFRDIWICICMCVYMYIHTNTHTHTYIYIYTYTRTYALEDVKGEKG